MLVCLLWLSACTTDKAVHICLGKGGELEIDAPTLAVGQPADFGSVEVKGPAFVSTMPLKLAENEKAIRQSVAPVFQRCPWSQTEDT